MTFNTARNILAVRFYGTEEGKEINRILNQVDENPWHTGTPTEEGWYFVAYKKRDCDGSYFWEYGARVWIEIIEGEGHWNKCEEEHPVIAWQRIEPFKEESNG